LAIAAAQGALQLVLRGYGDPDSIDAKGANPADVLADLKRARSVPVPARPPTATRPDPVRVRVFRDTLVHDLLLRHRLTDTRFQTDSAKRQP
jgi:hypothetical protein